MNKLTRRKFSSKLAKGAGGAALALHLPLSCAMGREKKKLGIALVGLGGYSTYQLAPALENTEQRGFPLAAIV